MHLVPCRWQKGGWKYVERDPRDVNYFQNPNRVNGTGFNPHVNKSTNSPYYRQAEEQYRQEHNLTNNTYGSFYTQ